MAFGGIFNFTYFIFPYPFTSLGKWEGENFPMCYFLSAKSLQTVCGEGTLRAPVMLVWP